MKSLRGRLLLGATISTLLVFALAGLAIYFLVRASLLVEFDQSLASKAAALASITEIDAGRLKVEYDAQQMPEFARKTHREYFQVWAEPGLTLRSETLADASLWRPESGRTGVFETTLPDGTPGRAIALTFALRQEDEEHAAGTDRPTASIVVARDRTQLDAQMSRLALLLLGVCGMATGLSLLATRIIVDRSLKPAGLIAEQICAWVWRT